MEGQLGDITVTSSKRKCSANSGSLRKLKDNAADWFNLMLRWNKLNQDGFNVAASIVNMKRSGSEQAELQDVCRRLQDIMDQMVAVVRKMERLVTSQRGVGDLAEFQSGPKGRACPLLHSWSSTDFEEAAAVMFDAFSREMELKQRIVEEVAHTVTPDLCLVYLSCWLHQPFIPDQNRRTLEAFLLETGHRPL